MTFRDTNLSVFRREPYSGVLWQPRIEHWYHTNRDAGTLPERYRGMTLLDVFDDLVLGISDEISPVGDIERVRLVSEICAGSSRGYCRRTEGAKS